MRQATIRRCHQCQADLDASTPLVTSRCPVCREAHSTQWRTAHTRQPGDLRTGWLIGDRCTVTLRKVTYQAKITDMSDRAEGDYLWVQLELTKTIKAFDGKPITQTWIHPEPVQSYKLRKAYVQ